LRRILWAAAAGLIVGGAVIAWFGTRDFWFVALALAATAMAAVSRQAGTRPQAESGQRRAIQPAGACADRP